METLVIIIFFTVGFIILAILVSRKSKDSQLLEIIKMLKTSSTEERRVLLESLQNNTHSLNQRLDTTARIIGDVQKNIGEMSEIGRSMRELQQFLSSPKLRGNIGEHVLKELLLQMLPKNAFHLQYSFRSGEKVDAAIKSSGGIIPIDSKFPMENFRKMMQGEITDNERLVSKKAFEKDVKSHIDAISKKYILTEEGTIDYALMYIPSEAVYYEVVNNLHLFDYAGDKRVLPVSPTTFYAYLKAILMSFEGQKVEDKAKEILANLKAIQKDYQKVEDNLGTLSRHLTNATNMMSSVLSSFSYLGQKISSTKSLGEEVREEVKQITPK